MTIRLGRRLVFTLFITFIIATPAFGQGKKYILDSQSNIRYVAPTGIDVGNCGSASSPCRNIQYAINQSISGDQILVAGGTYRYQATFDTCSFLQTRAIICFVDKFFKISGGYSVNNWLVADPKNNLTIIDGQNNFRGIAVIGYNTSSTYLEMDGFTIQNAQVQGPTYLTPYEPGGMGGGMLVQLASITLRDMVFKNNRVYGKNTTSGDGGGADGSAIRIESAPAGTTSIIDSVIFENNQSIGGSGKDRGGVAFGALFIYNSNVGISNSIFENNLAQAGNSTGSGLSLINGLNADALGGGIGIERGGEITLRNVTIVGNQVKGGNANQYGGGAFGAGILVEDTSLFRCYDTLIKDNIATAGNGYKGGHSGGGGIQSQNNNEIIIERSKIFSNSSIGGNSTSNGLAGPGAGGGLYFFSTRLSGNFNVSINNVVVANNLAQQGSGTKQIGSGGGGGIVVQGVNADISHATIVANRLDPMYILGQGIIVVAWPLETEAIPAFLNLNHSVIADHIAGGENACAIAVQEGSSLNLNQGLFSGNVKNINNDGMPIIPGIINGLSTMKSSPTADFISPGIPNFNYSLQVGSPARENAIGSFVLDDVEKENRPYSIHADLGAYEYWPFPLTSMAGDEILHLSWDGDIQSLIEYVNTFRLSVNCENDAKSPNELACGDTINLGKNTTFALSGLSNYKNYTIQIYAYDNMEKLIAESEVIVTFPKDIALYLPLVINK